MRQPGLPAGGPLEPGEEAVGEEGGLAVLGAEAGGGAERAAVDVLAGEAAVAALGQVVEPGLDVLEEPQADAEAGRHALESAQPRAVRRDATRIGAGVGVAEEDAVVAGAAQLGGEGLVAGVERRAVGDRAVVAGVEAGQQRGAGGAAGRGLAVVAGEGDGLAGEAVEDGRAGTGVAERAQRVAAPLVGGDEEDVQGSSPPRVPDGRSTCGCRAARV